MRTAKLHNLLTTQASACAMQACYRGTTWRVVRPTLSHEEILVEGAAFGRGSNDPIQEALL